MMTELSQQGANIPSEEAKVENTARRLFPFSAIVNQAKAKEALLIAVVNPAVHGVLFLGEKGSGKTTLVRSLTTLLPESRVIDLPLGSGEDMVLGTVDAEKTLVTGKVAVKSGILSRADGHILYIDEVNLLPDHLVDIILDAAAAGQYRLERDGISSSYNARFILVGSMNPEEGWLRPQLLDRFGLAVHVSALTSVLERAEVFRNSQAFERDPSGFSHTYQIEQASIRQSLIRARSLVARVTVPEPIVQKTIETIMALGVRTHRAELTALEAAKARAALNNRETVLWDDIQTVMPLALQHRVETMDYQQPVTWDLLNQQLLEGKKAPPKNQKGLFPTPFFRKKKVAKPSRESN